MTHIVTTEHITLSSFLANPAREERIPTGLITLIEAVADACSSIATAVERGIFDGASGNAHSENVHGEAQKKLDVVSNDIMIGAVESVGCLRGLASEELESIQVTGHEHSPDTPAYLMLFDPLDGSSNLEINGIVGSIFSVLATPASGVAIDERHFLQPGVKQVCAGYAIYGATTMFVLTTGHGVDGFTFDGESASFVLTHPQLQIPENTREFAINMSNERYWEEPVRRYVRECVAGTAGPRQTNFNMRWIASMVAEVHRILLRGGVFLYPRDSKNPQLAGRLRLTYEANPMSFIVEQAGGMSTTGEAPIMEVQPDHVHQRVPVILGSRLEVERLLRYHDEAAAA
ncbi:class 1 fructose-bisphosphatase [Paraburkholderia caffeinilytica]|uniref:class 1 fructose-bisphosphatase n=1 Tax=Paraburkholderia caffeinilytica TaxID=1761016 RepID=UPI0038BBEB34